MNDNIITVKDVNGQYVSINTLELTHGIVSGPQLFGFNMKAILELRRQYLLRGGKLADPSAEDIREAFEK